MVTVNAIDYDPVVGRFFSPDPFVQIPDFTQSYNRYSYCMNNPVMFNDPDGDTHYSHLSGVQGLYSMTIEPESKWKGNYFQGTEEEARQSLVETSMLFKTETAMWCTSRGYYFEPISGDPAYTYNYRTYCCDDNGMTYRMLHELNVNIGYQSNTINTTYRFPELDLINNELYLYPSNGPVSRVYYHAHTHPHNSEPSDADNQFSYYLGIPCRIFGWNGCVYYFGGSGFWH